MRGCGKGHHYLLHRDQNFAKDDRTNDDKGDQIKEQAQGQKGGVTQNDATESPHDDCIVLYLIIFIHGNLSIDIDFHRAV